MGVPVYDEKPPPKYGAQDILQLRNILIHTSHLLFDKALHVQFIIG